MPLACASYDLWRCPHPQHLNLVVKLVSKHKIWYRGCSFDALIRNKSWVNQRNWLYKPCYLLPKFLLEHFVLRNKIKKHQSALSSCCDGFLTSYCDTANAVCLQSNHGVALAFHVLRSDSLKFQRNRQHNKVLCYYALTERMMAYSIVCNVDQ